MTNWVCIGWHDQVIDEAKGKRCPTPVTKLAECPDDFSKTQVLTAFRLKHPELRNHTVHRESDITVKQVVKHRGPGNYPIALETPISPAIQATQEAHGTPALRGSDGALQIEPPEQITAPALAGQAGVGERARKPRSLAKQLAESDSNQSLNALAQGPQKPVRSQTVATTTHPSSKGCPLPCTDSSERAIAASAV